MKILKIFVLFAVLIAPQLAASNEQERALKGIGILRLLSNSGSMKEVSELPPYLLGQRKAALIAGVTGPTSKPNPPRYGYYDISTTAVKFANKNLPIIARYLLKDSTGRGYIIALTSDYIFSWDAESFSESTGTIGWEVIENESERGVKFRVHLTGNR